MGFVLEHSWEQLKLGAKGYFFVLVFSTPILQDSLGGNARTVVIANISPGRNCFQETYGTLGFARRAKQIRNKVCPAATAQHAAYLRSCQGFGHTGRTLPAEFLTVCFFLSCRRWLMRRRLPAVLSWCGSCSGSRLRTLCCARSSRQVLAQARHG